MLLDSSLGNAGIIKTWWLGIRLRFQISSLKRISAFRAFLYRYGNMALRIINKLTLKRKKTILGGGRFIAITGLDGSGKTSIIEHIHSVLSKDFTVKKIHIGRPPATIITLSVRLALTIRKKIKSKKDILSNNQKKNTTLEKTSLLAALRYAALAYERNALARKAYKNACKGEIIISDRYPSVSHGKMDSPRISAKNTSPTVKWLARIEQHYYKMMPKPDFLLELYVPVEVAIKRNQERLKEDKETDEEIKERYKDNSNLKYKALKHLKLNNDQPFENACINLLEIVWEKLR
jgi:thymidylate kinase